MFLMLNLDVLPKIERLLRRRNIVRPLFQLCDPPAMRRAQVPADPFHAVQFEALHRPVRCIHDAQ